MFSCPLSSTVFVRCHAVYDALALHGIYSTQARPPQSIPPLSSQWSSQRDRNPSLGTSDTSSIASGVQSIGDWGVGNARSIELRQVYRKYAAKGGPGIEQFTLFANVSVKNCSPIVLPLKADLVCSTLSCLPVLFCLHLLLRIVVGVHLTMLAQHVYLIMLLYYDNDITIISYVPHRLSKWSPSIVHRMTCHKYFVV